jgi:hypothetical protein
VSVYAYVPVALLNYQFSEARNKLTLICFLI